jgi:hypothetical protein
VQEHQRWPLIPCGRNLAIFNTQTINNNVFHTLNRKSRTISICSSDWNIGA